MRFSNFVTAGVLGVTLQATAIAQIYESKDAEGVPEFSDTPTQGAEVVKLPATNVSNAPAVPPPSIESEPVSPGAPEKTGEPQEDAYGGAHYGDDEPEDVRARRRVEEKAIHDAHSEGAGSAVDNGHVVPGSEHVEQAGGAVGEASGARREGAVHHKSGGRR